MSTAVLTQIRSGTLWSQIKSNLVLICATGFLLLLILVPLVRLIVNSFQLGHPAMPEGWTLQNYLSAYSLPAFYRALGTTIVLSVVGTIITLSIAILFAWLIERTDMPLRNLAWTLILIPMAVPGVLFALGWALLLSPKTGAMNLALRDAARTDGNSGQPRPAQHLLSRRVDLSGRTARRHDDFSYGRGRISHDGPEPGGSCASLES